MVAHPWGSGGTARLIRAITTVKDPITAVVGVDTLMSIGTLELIESAVVNAALFISPIHTVSVSVTHIAGAYTAVVWALELFRVA